MHTGRDHAPADITCCWRAFPSRGRALLRRMPDVNVDTQLQYSCLHIADTKRVCGRPEARHTSLPSGPSASCTRKHARPPSSSLVKEASEPACRSNKGCAVRKNRCTQPPVNPVPCQNQTAKSELQGYL